MFDALAREEDGSNFFVQSEVEKGKIGPSSFLEKPYVESRRGNGVSQDWRRRTRKLETTSSSVWRHLLGIKENVLRLVLWHMVDMQYMKAAHRCPP